MVSIDFRVSYLFSVVLVLALGPRRLRPVAAAISVPFFLNRKIARDYRSSTASWARGRRGRCATIDAETVTRNALAA